MQLKEKLEKQHPLIGAIVTMSLPSVSEVLSECGFDWLWIDMEHAPFDLREVQEMLRAKKNDCAALVRVPSNSDEWIQRVLDLGVEGVIVPHVNTAEEAERAVKASLYPLEGHRSAGLTRASRYGMDANYRIEANRKRSLFVQIEHHEGVKNAQSIVQIPGLDGVIIGPYDLSASYGKPGQIHDPEVVEAIKKVLHTCRLYNKPVGIFAKHLQDAKE